MIPRLLPYLLFFPFVSSFFLDYGNDSSVEYTDAQFFGDLFGGDDSDVIESGSRGVRLASWKFEYVRNPLILTTFIVLIGLFKLFYHHTMILQRVIPESCCLIAMGALLGTAFLGNTDNVKFLEFDSQTFFFILLPPIILEASYSLKDRAFIENLGTILLYAVVGTILNIALIGGGLIALSSFNLMGSLVMDPLDSLLFAALIAAVDPVAVLAIFQEVGVNKMLYFMVFGESLLNDAVTVVCYTLLNEFKSLPHISVWDCVMGVISFVCVSLGGTLIGSFFGVLSAIVTRYTTHVRVVEPVMLFGLAYLAYVSSELFHWSGIIGILVCGLVQAHYACGNISSKSFISVTYFAKVASSVSESLIFIILGVMLVNENAWFWSDWHPIYALWALVLCLGVRSIVVFFLTYLANRSTGGVRHVAIKEQIIMSYGGLRGAVSFSLAFMISDSVPTKNTLLAATYLVILFTVFVQGCTIKFLVKFLNIRLAKKEDKMRLFIEFNDGMIGHLSQGIEDLCGYQDKSVMGRASALSRAFLRPILQRDYVKSRPEEKLLDLDRQVTVRENMRKSSSVSSFKQHQVIERMTEEGSISREMMEDDDVFDSKEKRASIDELEHATDLLTKDAIHIRKLISNPLDQNHYANRNLVAEDDKEKRETERSQHMKMIQLRAKHGFSERRKRSIFGQSRIEKKNMKQALISSSVNSLAVQSLKESSEGQRPRTLSIIKEQEIS